MDISAAALVQLHRELLSSENAMVPELSPQIGASLGTPERCLPPVSLGEAREKHSFCLVLSIKLAGKSVPVEISPLSKTGPCCSISI